MPENTPAFLIRWINALTRVTGISILDACDRIRLLTGLMSDALRMASLAGNMIASEMFLMVR
jgi:deoxyribodipyrimidine photolyase